jgi:hypothetical protein
MTPYLTGKPLNAFVTLLLALGGVLLLVFILYGAKPDGVISQVRIRNATGMPIKELEVNGIDYGELPAGGVSRYQDMKSAYTIAKVELVMNRKRIRLVPDDMEGERPLGAGRFTYLLVSQQTGTMHMIEIQAVKDGD